MEELGFFDIMRRSLPSMVFPIVGKKAKLTASWKRKPPVFCPAMGLPDKPAFLSPMAQQMILLTQPRPGAQRPNMGGVIRL